ncbi:MAG: hypothetical protein U1F52_05655 [Burkholderiales bacterium]
MFPHLRMLVGLAGLAVASAFAVSPAMAVDPVALDQTRTEFFRAVQGDGAAVTAASARFQTLLDQEPDNVVLRAYLGSCLTLQGREALMPWTKMRLVEAGLTHIDKALAQLTAKHDAPVPDGLPPAFETRLVAASTFLRLPDLFHRFDAGKRVVDEAMRHPAFASLSAKAQSGFLYQSARVAQKEGRRADEISALRKALAGDPRGVDSPEAQKRLKDLGA